MAALERRQGLASGGVRAEGAGLTDGRGLPQARQLATAQATPRGTRRKWVPDAAEWAGCEPPDVWKEEAGCGQLVSVPGLCPRGHLVGGRKRSWEGQISPPAPAGRVGHARSIWTLLSPETMGAG